MKTFVIIGKIIHFQVKYLNKIFFMSEIANIQPVFT